MEIGINKVNVSILSESDKPMLNALKFCKKLELDTKQNKDILEFYDYVKLLNDSGRIELRIT